VLARASLGKESSANAKATPASKPDFKAASQEQESTIEEFTPARFAWSIGNIAMSAPGGIDPPSENNARKSPSTRMPALPWPVQAKLEIGAVNDPLEHEADHVAEQVMRMPSVALHASVNASPIVHEVLRSPGQPLDAATRTFMESHFARDFSRVRIHTDARAAESARVERARAYTVGHDVVFGANLYAPASSSGRELLAHELAHTIQQRNTSGPPPSPELQGIAELSARAASRQVARGERVSAELPGSGIGLSRSPDSPELPSKIVKNLKPNSPPWQGQPRISTCMTSNRR
jgi:hypothetical protein